MFDDIFRFIDANIWHFVLCHSYLMPFVAQNGKKGVPNALAVMLIEENFVTLLRRTRVYVHNVRTTGETKEQYVTEYRNTRCKPNRCPL